MRFDLDRLPTDPVLLQKILREMAEAMELERAELQAANATARRPTGCERSDNQDENRLLGCR